MIRLETKIQIPTSEIRQQVELICSSAELGTKLQLCRLFRYIVDETIEGRANQLKGYTIGLEVFNLGEDFDPEQNPIVRIHAGRLRRMLRLYYLEGGKDDSVKIEIPKGKYIPFFSKRHQSSESGDLPSSAQDKSFDSPPAKRKSAAFKVSIAILPFKNLTGNPDKEYLALGFAEELSVELTKFDDLLVLNPILLLGSEQSQFSIHDLKEGTKVHFVIEGSIQISKDQIKILVRLIDMDKGEQIWAERFINEFTSQDLTGVLENIARQVSGILGSEYGIILQSLSSDFKKSIHQNTDSFSSILKYYYYEATHSPETASEAFFALEQALMTDPDSGIITAMLASMYGTTYMLDLNDASTAFNKMGLLAERALMLDPNNMTVRVIFAYKCFAYNEKQRFITEAERCLARCSLSALRLTSLGMHLSLYGEWEKGINIINQVKDLGISYPRFVLGATCLYHYRKKEYARALDEANQYNVPAMFWGPLLRTAVLGQLNRLEEAKSHISHLKQLKPDFENQARYLITRYVKEEELAEHVVEGLRKAGMQIKPSHNKDN